MKEKNLEAEIMEEKYNEIIKNKKLDKALSQCAYKVILDLHGIDALKDHYPNVNYNRCINCSGYNTKLNCYMPMRIFHDKLKEIEK